MVEHVPGVHIPESVLQRIAGAGDQKAEAKTVLVETIRAVSEIEARRRRSSHGLPQRRNTGGSHRRIRIPRGVSTRAA
jgi:hypothetical protein